MNTEARTNAITGSVTVTVNEAAGQAAIERAKALLAGIQGGVDKAMKASMSRTVYHDRLLPRRDVLRRNFGVCAAETVQRYLPPGEGDGGLHAVLVAVSDPHVFLCADSRVRDVVLLPDGLVALPPQPVNGPAHGGFHSLVHAALDTGQQRAARFRPRSV